MRWSASESTELAYCARIGLATNTGAAVRRGGRVDAALGACRTDLRIMWRPLLVIRVSQLACRAAGHR
jgi:hypothetical protein